MDLGALRNEFFIFVWCLRLCDCKIPEIKIPKSLLMLSSITRARLLLWNSFWRAFHPSRALLFGFKTRSGKVLEIVPYNHIFTSPTLYVPGRHLWMFLLQSLGRQSFQMSLTVLLMSHNSTFKIMNNRDLILVTPNGFSSDAGGVGCGVLVIWKQHNIRMKVKTKL